MLIAVIQFHFFCGAIQANPGGESKLVGSRLYVFRHLLLKFSRTSAKNKVLLLT